MSAADVCREAAQKIAAEGLWQGVIGTGGYCLWSALREANGQRFTFTEARDAYPDIVAAISSRLGTSNYTMEHFDWNDAPGRTSEDVQKLLLQVADDLDVAP